MGLLAPAGNTPGGHMPLAQGIIATAQALGMNPADLATVISYETAGTFDPTKRGPTTQWGEHRGLIQFGEPQARQYGVDWSDPVGSQLGPNGAVARYFRENGWQPGMGLLDAYSIVNAGGPGRYNASDANNGGAPGTVADKVNEQMGGHRENAMRLLEGLIDPRIADAFAGQGQGGQAQSASTGSGGLLSMPPAPERRPSVWDRLEGKPGLGVLADPERRARLAIALQGMSMFPNPGFVDMLQQDITTNQESEERRRLAAWLASQPGGANAAALIGAGADPSAATQWYVESQTPQPPIIEGDMVYDARTGELIADHRQPEPQASYMTGAEVESFFPGVQVQDPEALYVMGEDGIPKPVEGTGTAADPTAAMENYNFLIGQGVPEAEAVERAFGSTGTTVNVGAGESAFDKKTGELMAEQAASVAEQGALAQRSLGQLQALEAALAEAPQGLSLERLGASLGLPVEGRDAAQLADSIISAMVPGMRPPGSGTMSDGDVALFKAALPRLANSPEGNRLIVQTLKAIAEYDVARGSIAQRLQLGEITQQQAAQEYAALGNPISDDVKSLATGATAEAAPAAAADPAADAAAQAWNIEAPDLGAIDRMSRQGLNSVLGAYGDISMVPTDVQAAVTRRARAILRQE